MENEIKLLVISGVGACGHEFFPILFSKFNVLVWSNFRQRDFITEVNCSTYCLLLLSYRQQIMNTLLCENDAKHIMYLPIFSKSGYLFPALWLEIPVILISSITSTGKSLSEALILGSTNPKYDKKMFIDLLVQYMKTTSSEHVVYTNCFLF